MNRIPFSPKSNRIWGSLLALAILVAATAEAQRRRPRGPVKLPDYYHQYEKRETVERSVRARLRNGLSVVIEEYSPRPIAAIALRVGSGYADEAPGQEGAAASLQWFVRRHSQIPARIAQIGGLLEGTISDRETMFLAVVPASEIEEAVQIFSDLLNFLPLQDASPEHLQISAAVGDGYRRWLSGSGALARLWNMAYPETGSRVSALEVAGAPVSNPEIDVATLVEFHKAHYRPSNVVLAVSGSVVRESVLAKAAEVFAKLEKGAGPSTVPTPARAGPSFGYQHVRVQSDAAQVYFGFPVPGLTHPDMVGLRLLTFALGGGKTSLLERHLGESKLAHDAAVEMFPSDSGGLLVLRLTPDPERVDAAEVGLLALLDSLQTVGLRPEELQRAKAQLVRETVARLRRIESRAVTLSRQIEGDQWHDLVAEVPTFLAVDNARIKEIARRYLRRAELSLLEVFPASAPERLFSAKAIQETFTLLLPTAAGELLRDEEKTRLEEIPPLEIEIKPRDKQNRRLKRTSVLRGPIIFLEEEHTAPLVDLGFFYPGGRIEETAAQGGMTALMLRSLAVESGSGGDWPLWRSLEARGATIQPVAQADFFGFTIQVPASYLDEVLPRFLDWLRSAGVRQSRFEIGRNLLLARQANSQSDPFGAARKALYGSLFPDHPYGQDNLGQRESLLNVEMKAVAQWHAEKMRSVHPVIILYGDLEGTGFLPDLISVLSNSRFQYKEKVRRPPGQELSVPKLMRVGEGWMVGGIQGPARGTRDDWVLDVVKHLVELKGVREAKPGEPPFPPGVRLDEASFYDAGAIVIERRVDPGQIGDRSWFGDVARLGGARITEDEVRTSVVLTITDFYRRAGESEGYLLRLAHNLLAGEKTNFQNEYLTTLRSLRADDIRVTASRFLGQLARFAKAPEAVEQP